VFLRGYSTCMTGGHCFYGGTQPVWPGPLFLWGYSTCMAGGVIVPTGHQPTWSVVVPMGYLNYMIGGHCYFGVLSQHGLGWHQCKNDLHDVA
jgi:hypothetical protein